MKKCPCCGETYTPAPDEIAVQCACEWEGCDENCPHVGHLYAESGAKHSRQCITEGVHDARYCVQYYQPGPEEDTVNTDTEPLCTVTQDGAVYRYERRGHEVWEAERDEFVCSSLAWEVFEQVLRDRPEGVVWVNEEATP